jgi:hypothetical protein
MPNPAAVPWTGTGVGPANATPTVDALSVRALRLEDHLNFVLDPFIWIVSRSVINTLHLYPLTLPSADTPELREVPVCLVHRQDDTSFS